MNLQAVIFDMDGVIVDTEPEYQRVELELVHQVDSSITVSDLQRYTGIHPLNMWRDVQAKYNLPQTPQQLYEQEEQRMHAYYQHGRLQVIEPTIRLIEQVHAGGYRMAIASSSEKENILQVLKRVQIEPYFDAVVSNDDVQRSKPYPDIYLLAAQRLGVAPQACVVIEDSAAGTASAQAAGMQVVRYIGGGGLPGDVQADRTVHDMREVTLASLQAMMQG